MKMDNKNNYSKSRVSPKPIKYIGIDDEWYNAGVVMRYDLDRGFYVRFADGRWMMSKNGNVKGADKIYYIPPDYKESHTIINLEKLDKIASRNVQINGKLISIVLKNGKEEISFIGIVRNIEKIFPSGVRDKELKDLLI